MAHLLRTAVVTIVAAAASVAATAAADAGTCDAVSRATVPAIIELYTSEGCNSCPPADRWLSARIASARQGQQADFIALAFHVDYWDYLGWKDAFAQPAFAQRQSALARRGGASGVYTPQVFVNGRDDRSWTRSGAVGLASNPAAATVRFDVTSHWRDDGITISGKVVALDSTPLQPVRLRYAVTENGLVTAVRAGENRGETLRHDAVVRAYGALSVDAHGAFAGGAPLPRGIRRDASVTQVIAEDLRGNVLAAATLACGDAAPTRR